MAKILVVEDSLTVISRVESLLRANGHRVYQARDGLAALAAVRAFTPELMLLDILLPSLNGIAVCTAIRGKCAYDKMPIIMLTGLGDETTIKLSYEAGANGFLAKPFRENVFLATIEAHLAKLTPPLH